MFDILKHIFLSGLNFGHYAIDLHDALTRARRGALTFDECCDLERVGSALLALPDWSRPPSGLFDRLGIILPIEDCLDDVGAMRKRLRFMIDFAGADTESEITLVRHLNQAISTKGDREFSINRLAADLVKLGREWPDPVEELVSGRTVGADAAAGTPLAHDLRWLRVRRDMTIMWLLFDLQIVAYRIWCAEWSALETSSSAHLKLGGLGELVTTMWTMANQAMADHAAGKHGDTIDGKLDSWCRATGVDEMGRTNEALLRASGELTDDDHRHADIQQYLVKLQSFILRIHQGFETSRTERFPSAANEARHALGQSAKSTSGPIPTESVWRHDIATERFCAPALVMLCVAVLAACDVLKGLKRYPAVREVSETIAPIGNLDALPSLVGAHGLARIERILFAYFRVVIVKDKRAFTGESFAGGLDRAIAVLREHHPKDGPAKPAELLDLVDLEGRLPQGIADDARKIYKAGSLPADVIAASQIPYVMAQVAGVARA